MKALLVILTLAVGTPDKPGNFKVQQVIPFSTVGDCRLAMQALNKELETTQGSLDAAYPGIELKTTIRCVGFNQ